MNAGNIKRQQRSVLRAETAKTFNLRQLFLRQCRQVLACFSPACTSRFSARSAQRPCRSHPAMLGVPASKRWGTVCGVKPVIVACVSIFPPPCQGDMLRAILFYRTTRRCRSGHKVCGRKRHKSRYQVLYVRRAMHHALCAIHQIPACRWHVPV